MSNLNMNQFALPGMEHLAHPGAPYLAKGIRFERTDFEGEQEDPGGMGPFSKYHAHVHNMYAVRADTKLKRGNTLGELQWAGSRMETGGSGNRANYPGEISWVQRSMSGGPRHRGMMAAMYHLAHQLPDASQTTVPIHSPHRTPEGEAWSAKVGGPRPRQNDYGWKPPVGIHPYEQREIQEERAKRMTPYTPGQQSLF